MGQRVSAWGSGRNGHRGLYALPGARFVSDAFAIDEGLLPTQLKLLVPAIGLPKTMQLLAKRGGTRIHLRGERARRDRELLESIIGADDAAKLRDVLGWRVDRRATPDGIKEERIKRDSIDLPKIDKIVQQVRDAAIRADPRSLMDLALEYRLTVRQVQNIRSRRGATVRRADEHDARGDLFGPPS